VTIRLDFFVIGAFAVVAIGLGTPGCSRRSAVAPPTPAEAPPAAAAPEEPAPVAPPTPVPPPEMAPAFFDFDSNLLGEQARNALDQVAKLMRDHAEFEVMIEGHCDERGTSEYNMALGERRATTAREYMVRAGVARERILVVSYGEERPFESGHDEAAWAKNRRAQFVVKHSTLSGGASD